MKTTKPSDNTTIVLQGVAATLCATFGKKEGDNHVVVKGQTDEVLFLLTMINAAVVKSLVKAGEMSHEDAVLSVGKCFFMGTESAYDEISEGLKVQEVQ